MNNQARSTANSAAKLSYREHERLRGHDEAPQLPHLGFQRSSGQREHDDRLFLDASAMPADHVDQAPPTAANSHYGFQNYNSILHNPGVQAELPAESSPVERLNERSTNHDSGAFLPASTGAKHSLESRRHAEQRLSTDYTWRPGHKAGAFI